MKNLVLSLAMLFTAHLSQAESMPPQPGSQSLPVAYVKTGLRANTNGGYNGSISITQKKDGFIEIMIDDNVCTQDGLCTMMEPIVYTDVYAVLVNETSRVSKFRLAYSKPNQMARPIFLEIDKQGSYASIRIGNRTLDATSYDWVVKSDGVITCSSDNIGVSLTEMSKQLQAVGVSPRRSLKAMSGGILPTVCGIPAGQLNAYLINRDGLVDAFNLGFENFKDYPFGFFISIY